MSELWPFQATAVNRVLELLAQGKQSVCLVSPTGSGKTTMGTEIARRRGGDVLWLAHRRELVAQAQARGAANAATIQGLLASGSRPPAQLIVHDECHHDMAEQWRALHADYPEAKHVGLTATPQRGDGKPLGDCYQELVVAAQYSQLIAEKRLVPAIVFSPPLEFLRGKGTQDIALAPGNALLEYAPGRHGFGFAPTKELCRKYCGEVDRTIFDDTPVDARDDALRSLPSRRLIWSVQTMTEGVDVPSASVIVLAGNCGNDANFLQKCGRGLRAFQEKQNCVVIDLVGATMRYGSPSEDRTYSLTSLSPISRTSKAAMRQCIWCGYITEAWRELCPGCGKAPPALPKKRPKIWSLALEQVFDGVNTPIRAKNAEWQRLLSLCRERGYSLYVAIKEYKKLFGPIDPWQFQQLAYDERRGLYLSIRAASDKQRTAIYKSMTGSWPAREWRTS